MANRYWVGGTGTWNTSSTTNWSASSGGASGASVPTAADSVFFDQAGTYTVTCTGALTCLDITVSAGTVTFAQGTAPTFAISGSMSLVPATVWSTSGAITWNATSTGKTIDTGGITFGGNQTWTFNGSGGGWTLASNLNLNGANNSILTITAGTLSTSVSNYAITFGTSTAQLTINGGTLSLNGSTLTVANFSYSSGTFNAGTSQININGTSSPSISVTAGSATFYNVAFTNTATNTYSVTGTNTFNNFSVTGPSTAYASFITFFARQTINGTFSTTGTAGNRRVWFRGVSYGLAQTITVNGSTSLTDADFRDLYIVGTAAPISGTRIGNRGGTTGITFDAPKTVYWATAAGGNWSGTNWAATSGGAVADSNFPLPQDTATFVNTGLNTSATVTVDTNMASTILAVSGVDMSARTNAMTFATGTVTPIIHGDWKNGSGTTLSGTGILTFGGRNTQTITSASKTFTQPITVDSYGGTVQLGDALNIGTTNALTVTNGTFDTKNFNVTLGIFASNNSNVRTITLGSSTVTINNTTQFTTTTNLTFNAGTSQLNFSGNSVIFAGAGLTYYNVSCTSTSTTGVTFQGVNVFNNLTVTAPSTVGIKGVAFSANQTINGTLTIAGAAANQRMFVYASSTNYATTATLTVNSLTANDCDFRSIIIAGAAAGTAPTRAGDCGNNTGITFPALKTVYWNLAGTQNWSATGWATSSGGTPAANNFPLPQDTAVFDNAGSAGTVTFNAAWNIGTMDASTRTSAMTLANAVNGTSFFGDWKSGTGLTTSGAFSIYFVKYGTQTITSNGVAFNYSQVTTANSLGTVQLADALTVSTGYLYHTDGTFDAVSYNVTVASMQVNSATSAVLKMGSGTWTLTGTATVWSVGGTSPLVYKGTANIVLSDTSTTARTFAAGNFAYNKLTIGGTTGTSTTAITSTNSTGFTELASTKTVAHTIDLTSANTLFVGAWTVTGTAGNVVTVSGAGTIFVAGPRVSGVDYLALGTTVISATSPGEFYAGANSTGGTNAILTTAPTPVTRYWVGGTGTWDATTTTNWSASSGGAGGASVPTSADAVIFNSASNATAYTATLTATQLRCAALTVAGPASGNLTFAGTAPLAIHGNTTFPATGLTRSYSGAITFSGNATGKTITSNGQTLASSITINGIGCGWTLVGALNISSNGILIYNGAFDTAGYNVTAGFFGMASGGGSANYANTVSLSLGSSTCTLNNSQPFYAGGSNILATGFTFNAGTSTLNFSSGAISQSSTTQPFTFYNVSYTSTNSSTTFTLFGADTTYNNLTFAAPSSTGIRTLSLPANITVNGTLTISAPASPTARTLVKSNTAGTVRTLTCAAVSFTDDDFADITIAGAAAPASGTRLGDCKGNSGITFPAAKTVYFNAAGTSNWTSTVWATSAGGTVDVNNFPLAQDTAIFTSTAPASGITISLNSSLPIGTIDMSARTSNTMTLATSTFTPIIYGDWKNGTGTTLTGAGSLTFSGRNTQKITSAGNTFTQTFNIDSPSGTIQLQDALTTNNAAAGVITLTNGTLDLNGKTLTTSSTTGVAFLVNAGTKNLTFNGGTLVIATSSTGAFNTNAGITGFTTTAGTGSGTISMTGASAKTFVGNGITYNCTLNQGGAGALTITGDNTFNNITNSYSATGATSIILGNTTQTVKQFTATGTAGNLLTIQGTSASSPATLVLTSGTVTASDYLVITGVRAYNLATTWYAGANSTNNGSLGWIFASGVPVVTSTGNFFLMF